MRCLNRIALWLLLGTILGTWKGYVALFDPGAAEPRQIFSCRVETLPAADQEALGQGILVRNDRDLAQLLEDYLS